MSVKSTTGIASVSFILSITYEPTGSISLNLLNQAGSCHMIMGWGNEAFTRNLCIINKVKSEKEAVIAQLKAIPGVHSVSLVPVSLPVQDSMLEEIRTLFADFGWDATSIDDETLSLFIASKINGAYTYYLDVDTTMESTRKSTVHIQPMTANPHFHPDWLANTGPIAETNENSGAEEEIITEFICIREEVDETEPPPPPNHQQSDEGD
jgi:hypothetical protein